MPVKLLTDLQILGCELHKNAFGGPPRPGLARTRWWSYSAPPGPLALIRGGTEGGNRHERVWNRKGEGKGVKG